MNNKNKSKVPVEVTRKSDTAYYESHNRLVTTKLGQVEKILPQDACRILETCGSCSLLNLDYKAQLLRKSLSIKEKFKSLASFYSHITVQHFVESEEKLAYRQSVRLVVSEHFVNGKPWIDIGFYRQTLNKIVDIGNCPIQSSLLNDICYFLRSGLKNFKVPIYSPKRNTGVLSGLILRSSRSTKQTFVTFLVREVKPSLFRELACQIMEKYSFIQGIFLLQDSDETKAPAQPVLLAGTNVIEEKFGVFNFKLSNLVEFPVHPIMTSKIYARIVELCDLTGRETILQVGSGTGALSCLLSRHARLVHAIDEKIAYSQNTELNIKNLNIKNIHVHCGKINNILSELKNSQSNCEAIVVHAPRKGLTPELVHTLSSFAPKHILYTSSFNDNFIEDLALFHKQRYQVVFVEPFDTHPGTHYFEVLCYLTPTS